MFGCNGLSWLARSRARVDSSVFVSVAFLLAGCSALIDTDPAKLTASSGGGGTCTPKCDDGVPCTVDECGSDNRCRFRPSAEACDDGVSCTEDICDPKKGCTNEASDERCEFCAPGSRCDVKVGGCIGFTSQRDCNDDDPCTKDSCNVAEMMCMSSDLDEDGDGHGASSAKGEACDGKDCDDTRAGVYPGAPEVCNGRDDNCNGTVDDGCTSSPDTCDSALDVMLSAQGSGMIEGSFGQVEANFDVPCGSGDAPDAIYRVPLKAGPSDIVLEAEADSAELVLAAGASCSEAGFRSGCAKPLARGGTRLVFHNYAGTELFVLVDAKDKNEAGDYRVKVTVTAAASDICSPTVFDHSGCGTLVGVIPMGQGALVGSCQGGGIFARGSEAVFRIESPAEKLTLSATGDGFSPVLYTRDGCSALSSEIDCQSRLGGGEVKVDVEAGGDTVYVVVDGAMPGQEYAVTCGP